MEIQDLYRKCAIITCFCLQTALEYYPYIRTEFSEKTSLKTKQDSKELSPRSLERLLLRLKILLILKILLTLKYSFKPLNVMKSSNMSKLVQNQ